jgi:Carboxypeptidase regulatory-like domain
MKIKYTKTRIAIFSILVIFFLAHFYHASPISGTVTDATTGQPVEGAVVIATWHSEFHQYHSPGNQEFEMQETLTDAQGRYTIPGWWIKFLPRFIGVMNTDEPEILAYKYAYKPEKTSVYKNGFPNLKIQLLSGTIQEKIEQFKSAVIIDPYIYRGCEWKNLTRILLEVDKQLQDHETYYANLYQNVEEFGPWFLKEDYLKWSKSCPGAVELLTNARKFRNKE